ncbi:hypothetical protein RJ641_029536 [Dillenia turbinata]|uniref:Uncharacterized protein n=1 Tax=Dillenia turbinata TaxID=194707 RepID=A0AAN8ZN33_9MAGN
METKAFSSDDAISPAARYATIAKAKAYEGNNMKYSSQVEDPSSSSVVDMSEGIIERKDKSK